LLSLYLSILAIFNFPKEPAKVEFNNNLISWDLPLLKLKNHELKGAFLIGAWRHVGFMF
jgi:hypothetical protein